MLCKLTLCRCLIMLTYQVEAEAKLPPCRRRHFQLHFLEWKVWISLQISLKCVPKARINTILALVPIMSGVDQATSYCLSQWWLVYWRIYASVGLNELKRTVAVPLVYSWLILSTLCLQMLRWLGLLNALVPCNVIWLHRILSTLVQVVSWCLMAPNYYLNQSWLTISKVQWHSPVDNSTSYLLNVSFKIT